MQQHTFILNHQVVDVNDHPGMVLVDVIRNQYRLKGTTVACREGDCGACTLLVGSWDGKEVRYRTITSCISPLANADGKHIVTIEGLSEQGLNPLQVTLMDYAGTQCGFCTPGFIVSLAGYFLNAKEMNYDEAIDAMDGNICRCTGYKSIERATKALVANYAKDLPAKKISLKSLVAAGIVPHYFLAIPEKLKALEEKKRAREPAKQDQASKAFVVGGGTDLFVQKPDEMYGSEIVSTQVSTNKQGIHIQDDAILIGAATRIEDLKNSPIMQSYIPNIGPFLKLFASTQIRQQGTVAGNIVNASPIGDLSNFFLALDTTLILVNQGKERKVALSNFYKGYKATDLQPDEMIAELAFPLPDKTTSYINLEKVSRRQFLDIASVTTSMHLKYDGKTVSHAAFSAGGVGPTPLYLKKMPAYLIGKSLDVEHVRQAVALAQDEVNPISDVRGKASYKRLLLRQLLYAHFVTCFPKQITMEGLLA